jgi:hypothetical protein
MENKNYFVQLNGINVNGHTEKKNGLTYLSWAWAWAEVKKRFPTAFYTIYENADGLFYHTDGNTCWVKTGVTIDGLEHIEYLPVMDFRNASIPRAKVTSFDVNKAIQRSLTKACARHGLGLYIYAGEDLPESEEEANAKNKAAAPQTAAPQTAAPVTAAPPAPQKPGARLDQIINEVYQCKTKADIAKVYKAYPYYKNNEQLIQVCKEQTQKISANA